VYCPEIAVDTYLHLSIKGDSYRLRAFNGALAGRAAWTQPDASTTVEFWRQYKPERQIDVMDERVNLIKNPEHWARIIERYNKRHRDRLRKLKSLTNNASVGTRHLQPRAAYRTHQ